MEQMVIKTDINGLIYALNERNRVLWKTIRKRENYNWFKNLWNKDANLYEFYELYKKVRADMGGEPHDFDYFDNLWQHYNLLSSKITQALNEWVELLVN